MNKLSSWIVLPLFIAVLLIGLVGVSCAPNEESNDGAEIGVILTSGTSYNSSITFYDLPLDVKTARSYPYATLGSIFYNPLVVDNCLYAIPQGLGNKKDSRLVIELDLSNLELKEFTIDQLAMNGIAASDEYIYTCNTGNSTSFINRCDKRTGEVESISIEDQYIPNVVFVNEKLYAFSNDMNSDDSSILCYTDDLSLECSVDISSLGVAQYRTLVVDEDLYFINGEISDTSYNGCVGILDVETREVSKLDGCGDFPSSIAFHDGKIYIADYDFITNSTSGSLYIVDNATRVVINRIDFDHGISQMVSNGDSLYILDSDKLYRYSFDSESVYLAESVTMIKGEGDYYSGIFPIKQS